MSTSKEKLDALRNAFDKKAKSGNQSWRLFYPFWKIPEDTVAVVRFLPDADPDNSLQFLVEKFTHDLEINGQRETVPCLREMYDEPCPICALSSKYYAADDKVMGKRYYRKKAYIGQVIVLESPIEHDQEQLVKLIEFGPAVFEAIKAGWSSGDLDAPPQQLKGGYNFRIKKTRSGQYASYATSSFAPRASDVSDEIIEKIQLFDLKSFLPKRIDADRMQVMLMADQTGTGVDEHEHESDVSSAVTHPTTNPKKVIEDDEAEPAEPIKWSLPKTETKAEPKAEPKAETEAREKTSKTSSALEQLRARARAAAANATEE